MKRISVPQAKIRFTIGEMTRKRIFFSLLTTLLLAACQTSAEAQPTQADLTNFTFTPTPAATTTPPILNAPENLTIQCGENLQLLGTLQHGNTLTLFKANGLEYSSSNNFIEGRLAGEVLVTSEIKGTNLRLQNNTLTQTSVCFVGFQNGGRSLGVMLPIKRLLNERRVSEPFEGSFLIQANGAEFGMEWLTYRYSTSSKKSCILYRIIQNPYPCNQDCAAIETEPGCECFCANFLYYDENCIPTEINPNCKCVCRGEGARFTPNGDDSP